MGIQESEVSAGTRRWGDTLPSRSSDITLKEQEGDSEGHSEGKSEAEELEV